MKPSFFERPGVRRAARFFAADVLLGTIALFGAMLLRFEGEIEDRYLSSFPYSALLLVTLQLSFLYLIGLYHVHWRHAGLRELVRVVYAVLGSVALFATLAVFIQPGERSQILPRSVMIMDLFLATAGYGGIRLLPRLRQGKKGLGLESRRPALIYGAGTAGEQLARDMLRGIEYPYYPAAFLDDDPRLWGTTIHGRKVLRGGEHLGYALEATGARTLIVAIPSADAAVIRQIVGYAREAKLSDIRILPGLYRLASGEVSLEQVREIDLEDLMGREAVSIETAEIERFLKDKRVLVTGAGGSIGSELVRRVLAFAPDTLCLLDHDETELFHLLENLKGHETPRLVWHVADIRDRSRINSIFASFEPDVVFHAAAYKHVPMIEAHPTEAAKTNILGTRIVAQAAARYGCEKFVLISTDKAVNPTSVMGATKRVAELVLHDLGSQAGCQFTTVRFGNVLGSRGSVVPIFREQIARRGPVTLTHPDMKRYFMTTEEACLLVLQAGAMAHGSEVLVLDMGQPVMIETLARELIRLSGHQPDVDIPIVYTGIRPGEKLFEEYLTAEEGVDATRHEKIFKARITYDVAGRELSSHLTKIEEAVAAEQPQKVLETILKLVPTYTPDRRHNLSGTPEPATNPVVTPGAP